MQTPDVMWEVAVDVGGTFVDVVALSPDGRVHASKHSRRAVLPEDAVLHAVDAVADQLGFTSGQVGRWLHGTTIATNILLERRASPVGVITNRGFSDVLTLGRQNRRDLYARQVVSQTPSDLMPEAMRVEIDGRLDAAGVECEPLSRASVVAALAVLHGAGVRSAAICLLFSHRNDAHERQVLDWCSELAPDMQLSLSSAVDPRAREFERWLTTALDAYVKPGVAAYLHAFSAGLAERGYQAPLIMRSSGGVAPMADCTRMPIALAMSGPAAAVNGVASMLDPVTLRGAAISIDIGGTSSDLSLLDGGQARFTQELQVGELGLRMRSLDIVSIPLGGGSIVRVNAAGAIRIGPDSAGAQPGPAAYGRGGELATITDCLVVLGLLPQTLASGLLLDRRLACAAVEAALGQPLAMTAEAAALTALRVANAQLGEAVKQTAFAAGFDTRELVLVAAGGGGGMHVAEAAERVGVRRVVVPALPGVAAAYGLLRSAQTAVRERAVLSALDDEGLAGVRMAAAELADAATMVVSGSYQAQEISFFLDVGYLGQEFTLEVPFYPDRDTGVEIGQRFDDVHTKIRGQAFQSGHSVRAVRAVASCAPLARRRDLHPPAMEGMALVASQPLYLPDHSSCPVCSRASLAPGAMGQGPMVVISTDSTVWVPPAWDWQVTDDRVLVLELRS